MSQVMEAEIGNLGFPERRSLVPFQVVRLPKSREQGPQEQLRDIWKCLGAF